MLSAVPYMRLVQSMCGLANAKYSEYSFYSRHTIQLCEEKKNAKRRKIALKLFTFELSIELFKAL